MPINLNLSYNECERSGHRKVPEVDCYGCIVAARARKVILDHILTLNGYELLHEFLERKHYGDGCSDHYDELLRRLK